MDYATPLYRYILHNGVKACINRTVLNLTMRNLTAASLSMYTECTGLYRTSMSLPAPGAVRSARTWTRSRSAPCGSRLVALDAPRWRREPCTREKGAGSWKPGFFTLVLIHATVLCKVAISNGNRMVKTDHIKPCFTEPVSLAQLVI